MDHFAHYPCEQVGGVGLGAVDRDPVLLVIGRFTLFEAGHHPSCQSAQNGRFSSPDHLVKCGSMETDHDHVTRSCRPSYARGEASNGQAAFALVYFMVEGISKVIFSLTIRPFPNWGWLLASGIVTILIAFYLWASLPVTAVWLLGVLLGIQLICEGAALGYLAWQVRTS